MDQNIDKLGESASAPLLDPGTGMNFAESDFCCSAFF